MCNTTTTENNQEAGKNVEAQAMTERGGEQNEEPKRCGEFKDVKKNDPNYYNKSPEEREEMRAKELEEHIKEQQANKKRKECFQTIQDACCCLTCLCYLQRCLKGK